MLGSLGFWEEHCVSACVPWMNAMPLRGSKGWSDILAGAKRLFGSHDWILSHPKPVKFLLTSSVGLELFLTVTCSWFFAGTAGRKAKWSSAEESAGGWQWQVSITARVTCWRLDETQFNECLSTVHWQKATTVSFTIDFWEVFLWMPAGSGRRRTLVRPTGAELPLPSLLCLEFHRKSLPCEGIIFRFKPIVPSETCVAKVCLDRENSFPKIRIGRNWCSGGH